MLGVFGATAAGCASVHAADWEEVPDCEPADFTVLTVPQRFTERGDPHAGMDAAAGSLEKLLELAAQDEAAGLGDAPWPPHFRKMEGEAPRVAPSRAKPAVKKPAAKKPRTKMPLMVVANSPNKEAALAGLEKLEDADTRKRPSCWRSMMFWWIRCAGGRPHGRGSE